MTAELLPDDDYPRFELLAKRLQSKFGNIYEYNLHGGDAGFDTQEWTVELKEAVRHYLLNELPDGVVLRLIKLDDETLKGTASKHEIVDNLISRAEPWEVAVEVRRAAVKAVPTLDELIGHLDEWPSEEERSDAEEWLLEHANEDVLKNLVPNLARDPIKDPFTFNLYDLTHQNRPYELLVKWHQAGGVVASDLTDTEWKLVEPHLPTGSGRALARSEEGRARLRRELNGMLYRHHYRTGWMEVPRRYGNCQDLIDRYAAFRHGGQVFRRLLLVLENAPGAERLVEWLTHVEVTRRSRK